jgi:hypothetical protein
MSLANLLTLPVAIVHREASGVLDEFGNDVPTEMLTQTVGELQQVKREEPATEGEVAVTTWDLFLPAATAIATGDAVIAGGAIYEVIGDPWDARSPRTGLPHHVEASLRRVGDEEGS